MIKVIITDDHALVRHGLRQILALAPDIEIVKEAGDGDELLAGLGRTPCDIALVDMNMPGLAGVDLIKRVCADHPNVSILVLSMHIEGQIASRALAAGAAGYLTKDSEPETLVAAIRKIAGGGRFIDAALVDALVFDRDTQSRPSHEFLSEREFQVFNMLAAGRGVSDIADELYLSVKTVSTHKVRLMQKMKLQTHTDLIRYAIKHRLID